MGKYTIGNFKGGINQSVDHAYVQPNQASDMRNFNVSKGALSTARGIKKYTEASLPNIDTIMAFYHDNTGDILAAAGDKIYKLSGDAFTEIGTGFTNSSFDYVNNNVNSKDVIVLANGADNVKLWDGTTLRDLKRDGANSTESTENKAPKGKYIELHYERTWLADDNTLYASKDLDPDDFTTPTDKLNVNQHGAEIVAYSNDGSKVVGLHVIYDDVVIFKEKSLFRIYGNNPNNYTKVQVFSSNGAIADKSIVPTNKGAYFISRHGIWLYDGSNCTLVSQEIEEIFKNANEDALSKACACYYDDRYILAIPYGTSTENNLIVEYNLTTKVFIVRDGFTVKSFLQFNQKLLFSSGSAIYEYETGMDYDGSAINAYWETAYNNLGVPNAIKELDECYVTAYGAGQMKVTAITEKKSKEKFITLSQTEKVYSFSLNNKGRLLKFRFENVNGSQVTVKDFTCIYDLDID